MKKTLSLLLLGGLAVAPLHAQEKASPEARMREALRNTTLQLRNIQAERDALSLKKDQAEQQVVALEGQVKTLTKRAAEDKDAYDAVKAKLAEEEARARQLAAQLEEWKAACNKATDHARKSEGERVALAEKVTILERTIGEQKDRNAAMYKIGVEILRRYESFGLGTAITAREPFVGTTRVKLENLVQDYSDKLADQRIKK